MNARTPMESTSARPPAIEAEGLGRDYGTTRALDALDLRVLSGGIVGLLGPNGAGKTTTMLLLATLLKPTRGRARVFGADVLRDRTAVRRRLGLVFQEATVDGLLTVEENLLFGARLVGLGGAVAREAVAAAIARTGLEARARQQARELSTGWRRLADLARALVHHPDLLVLDEPTVGLDPEHRERIWTLLQRERTERGTTILFSTHYLAEAEPCDRVVLLAGGRVVGDDTPPALKATVGEEVIEIDGIDGPDAERLLSAVRDLVAVRQTIRTDRGFRIGVSGSREQLARLAAAAPAWARLSIRPASLDDVYFARTQGARADATPPVTRAGSAMQGSA
jgi:ABC-type multidrug transport system ATPase subunit